MRALNVSLNYGEIALSSADGPAWYSYKNSNNRKKQKALPSCPARSLFFSPQPPHNTEEERGEIQWNLYQADTFETFPSVRLIGGTHLIEVVKIA